MLTTTDAGRDGANADLFFEPRLRFGIRKPPGWRFLPAAWSPTARIGQLTSKADWARHARLPFVSMTGDVRSPLLPRPAIQVTCRPVEPQSAAAIRRLLDTQLAVLGRELEEFERLAASLDHIIGGHRAAQVQYRYTLDARLDEARSQMRVLVRSYLVLTPGVAFTIAMSSSADARYYDERDFSSALASVRIGAAEGRLSGTRATRPRVIGWTGARKPSSS